MSYDFRITNGEWTAGQDGDLSSVVDTEKLIQDSLKIAVTPLGSNLSAPWYGSLISKSTVGSSFDPDFFSTVAEGQLQTALKTLASIQQKWNSRQMLTAAEQIAAVKSVSITKNSVDPRFVNVRMDILSKALTVISPQFQFSPLL